MSWKFDFSLIFFFSFCIPLRHPFLYISPPNILLPISLVKQITVYDCTVKSNTCVRFCKTLLFFLRQFRDVTHAFVSSARRLLQRQRLRNKGLIGSSLPLDFFFYSRFYLFIFLNEQADASVTFTL